MYYILKTRSETTIIINVLFKNRSLKVVNNHVNENNFTIRKIFLLSLDSSHMGANNELLMHDDSQSKHAVFIKPI